MQDIPMSGPGRSSPCTAVCPSVPQFPCFPREPPGVTCALCQAIHGFRETEKPCWSEASRAILQRVREAAFDPGQAHLPRVHVLDLEPRGYIKPHVDSVKRHAAGAHSGARRLAGTLARARLPLHP